MEASTPLAARGKLLATAVLFSTGGAAIKACAMSGWQVAGFRSGIAALALLVLVPSARRAIGWRSVPVGLAYAATLILFVLANKDTTAANTIYLQSTAPLYLVLLGPWLLGERPRRGDVAFMLALAVGFAFFFMGHEKAVASAPHPLRGNILAACSGVTYALMLVGLRASGRPKHGAPDDGHVVGAAGAAIVTGNVIAFLACMPLMLPLGMHPARDWLLLVYLGVFQIGLAYALLASAIRWVPALEASLLLLVEPILNPLWAWWTQGERPGAWAIAGSVVILAATAARTLAAARSQGEARC